MMTIINTFYYNKVINHHLQLHLSLWVYTCLSALSSGNELVFSQDQSNSLYPWYLCLVYWTELLVPYLLLGHLKFTSWTCWKIPWQTALSLISLYNKLSTETFNVLKLLFLHDIIQLSPKGRKTVMDIKLNICTKMQSIKVYI